VGRRSIISSLLAAAALASAAPAAAAPYRADEVIVHYAPGTTTPQAAATEHAAGTGAAEVAAPATRVVKIQDGQSVHQTIVELRRHQNVQYAVPNYIAHAADFVPNDPGRGGFAGWQNVQWNFLASAGVNAPGAWANMIAAGAPGGKGVTVAVLDTGVAFQNRGRFRRSPDFTHKQFVRGYDFVDRNRNPDDHNGHGTWIAGLIAEKTNNGVAVTGLAYGARIMPVRVLDADGLGDAAAIGQGIRFAVDNGAKVINLSLEFDPSTPGSQIPEVLRAIRYANRKRVLVVGVSGNESERKLAYPARASGVIAVGATTEHLCQADYSNSGPGLSLVAPGGGSDAALDDDPVHCRASAPQGRDIYQLTYPGSNPRRFGLPGGYEGTSMAAPHVAATAALVIASGVIGRNPTPGAIKARLEQTARDLGPAGYDQRYGWGLLDAAAATAPRQASTTQRR
jgi:serine protease